MTEKVKGPASYFPSIVKTYGKPIEHWFEQLAAHTAKTHKEQVEFLKSVHAMGHGHANAIVAYLKDKLGK